MNSWLCETAALGSSIIGRLGGGGDTTSDMGGVLAAMASLAAEQGKGAAAVSLFDRAITAIESNGNNNGRGSKSRYSRGGGGVGSDDDDDDDENGDGDEDGPSGADAAAGAATAGRRGFSVTMPAKVSRAVRLARLREARLESAKLAE